MHFYFHFFSHATCVFLSFLLYYIACDSHAIGILIFLYCMCAQHNLLYAYLIIAYKFLFHADNPLENTIDAVTYQMCLKD